MESKYKKLLSVERFRVSTVGARNVLLEAESDRGRLLFCPAFRRLQQKAQVFSLESNAAVRSRLTHSLEVSQMGRYISDQISIGLMEKCFATAEECSALVTFVETACLMHDIGNPPFGHFGESAISQWFRENGERILLSSCSQPGCSREDFAELIDGALADFLNFDGNPQGIRVVTKLQRNSDRFGLNLTVTTIASYLKYIRGGNEFPDETRPFTKKCGYFSTEKEIVEQVWAGLGYKEGQRFPLAYIMEAADDIAYCISDLEDSIEKGFVEQTKSLADIYGTWLISGPYTDEVASSIEGVLVNAMRGVRDSGEDFTYTDFRTSLNRILAGFSAKQYLECHDEILSGKCKSLIPEKSSAGVILQTLKDYCKRHVYRHEKVQWIELAGYRAIYGLLDQFSCLLEASEARFTCALRYDTKDSDGKPIIVENKLLSIFPKNYKIVYDEHKKALSKNLGSESLEYKILEWNLRAHLVTDFISGMTDDFALKTYRSLNGTNIQ